jgi:hypothetical protein
MKLSYIAAFALVALGGTTMQAEACNPLLAKNFGKHVAPTVLPAAMLAKNTAATARPGIVGLWHDVRTASDGSIFMEGFDTWFADGNEHEIGNFPPATGPVCVGIYTRHGRMINLKTHVTFLYDLNNNYLGTLNLTQQARLAPDGNSYTGPFDAKFFDPNGVMFMEVTGTALAERMVQ